MENNGYAFAKKEWTERTKTIAAAIPPGSTVIDLGGGEENLRKYLRKPTWYVSVDKKMCTPDTRLADFNKGEFPEILAADYVVAQGLVEYLQFPAMFFREVRKYGDMLIFTWLEPGRKMAEKHAGSSLADILREVKRSGWEIVFKAKSPDRQTVFYCTKKTP